VQDYSRSLLNRLLAVDFPIRVQSAECGHSWVLSATDKARLRQITDDPSRGSAPNGEASGEPVA
jgi:hypothetical protein